jgi:NACalpha-BTF3-like transcription factor
MSDPARHAGKTVQVKGKITETCERMGCWMNLADESSGQRVRIKVNDGEIVFPKTAVGKVAVARGKLVKLELTHDQAVAAARHEAEEQNRKFDPNSVKSGATMYQIQGEGAVIFD